MRFPDGVEGVQLFIYIKGTQVVLSWSVLNMSGHFNSRLVWGGGGWGMKREIRKEKIKESRTFHLCLKFNLAWNCTDTSSSKQERNEQEEEGETEGQLVHSRACSTKKNTPASPSDTCPTYTLCRAGEPQKPALCRKTGSPLKQARCFKKHTTGVGNCFPFTAC